MVEGKTLAAFRDVVVIIGMLVLCFLGMQDFGTRMQARREQEARFAVARNAVIQLDEAYKQLVTNKSMNEQIFRQNEILLQYQKLLVTLAYMPAPVPTIAGRAPGKAAPPKPK